MMADLCWLPGTFDWCMFMVTNGVTADKTAEPTNNVEHVEIRVNTPPPISLKETPDQEINVDMENVNHEIDTTTSLSNETDADPQQHETRTESPESQQHLKKEFNKTWNMVHSKTTPGKLLKFYTFYKNPHITAINNLLQEKIEQLKEEVKGPNKKHTLIKSAILTAGFLLRKKITGRIGKVTEEPKYKLTEKKIEHLNTRITLAKQIQNLKSNNINKDQKQLATYFEKLRMRPTQFIKHTEDRITLLKKELTRQKKRHEIQKQRRICEESPSAALKTTPDQDEDELDLTTATTYYKDLYKKQNINNKTPILDKWLQEVSSHNTQDNLTTNDAISTHVQNAIKTAKSWKAPGIDRIPGYLYKIFPAANTYITKHIQDTINGKYNLSEDDVRGKVVLLHKNGDKQDPRNYRPIALLNTDYKLTTSTISKIITESIGPDLIPKEQLSKPNTWGAVHGLLEDKAITQTARMKRRKHYSIWFDFQKAYDSLTHKAIIKTIRALPIDPKIKAVIIKMTKIWNIVISHRKKLGEKIKIRRGVYQGDCTSSLIFVIVSASILYHIRTHPAINKTSKGTHSIIAYMDDIKCHAADEKTAKMMETELIAAAKEIGMQLNAKKSAYYNKKDEENDMFVPKIRESYKYLGLEQTERDTNQNFVNITEKTLIKTEQLLRSDLTTRQKKNIFNSTIVPAVIYVTGNIYPEESVASTLLKCRKLDEQIRKLAMEAKIKTKPTSNQRLYLPESLGGLGFRTIETETSIQYVRRYVYLKNNPDLNTCLRKYTSLQKAGYRTPLGDFEHVKKKYDLDDDHDPEEGTYRQKTNILINAIKKKDLELRKKDWAKSMSYPKLILQNEDIISFPATTSPFLDSSKLCFLNAAAEEQLFTLRARPGNEDRNCRRCGKAAETAYHVASTCSFHSYSPRHDQVVYWLIKTVMLCTKAPDDIMKNLTFGKASINADYNTPEGKIQIRAGMMTPTRHALHHNKPDVTVHLTTKDKEKIFVFEVSVPHVQNYKVQERIKRTRYSINSTIAIDHNNCDSVRRDTNLIEEIRRENRCEVELGLLIVGCYGEILKTEEHNKFEAMLNELGVSERSYKHLMQRVTYSTVTQTCQILMRHL